MEILLAFVGLVGLVFLTTLFTTWVLSNLWAWYITPIFGLAVPQLHLLYGLVLIVAFISHSQNRNTGKDVGTLIAESLAKGIVFLFFGWIVHITWGF
jgi:hypothetical protein